VEPDSRRFRNLHDRPRPERDIVPGTATYRRDPSERETHSLTKATRRKGEINMTERRTKGQRRTKDGRQRLRATRLAYSIRQLTEYVGVGRSMIYAEIGAGRLKASKAGRRTIVTRENAKAWLRGLPTADTPNRTATPDEHSG
jgi:excisionase family DNA binding protein